MSLTGQWRFLRGTICAFFETLSLTGQWHFLMKWKMSLTGQWRFLRGTICTFFETLSLTGEWQFMKRMKIVFDQSITIFEKCHSPDNFAESQFWLFWEIILDWSTTILFLVPPSSLSMTLVGNFHWTDIWCHHMMKISFVCLFVLQIHRNYDSMMTTWPTVEQ